MFWDKRTALLIGSAALLALGIFFWWITGDAVPSSPSGPGVAVTPPASPALSNPMAAGSFDDQLQALLGKFQSNSASAADLAELRRSLLAAPKAGLAAVEKFLASGADAATGLTLTVGPGGILSAAPTLRLFLLDLLGQLARLTGSSAGGTLSRTILEKKESPDEWALALRNVAWADPKARPFLAAKMHEMLAYEPWRATPTAGMLEAFDVTVYSGDPTFVPELADLARTGPGELRRAATVALDRLAENSPLAVMNFLNANPSQIADRPMVRADYFAKADLRDPAQREAVERYLDRPDADFAEKTKFLHAIAAPGSFVADSLLETAVPAPDDGARYQAIAASTAGWLRANRFPALRGEIEWLLGRVTSEP